MSTKSVVKPKRKAASDEMRPEYDFSKAKPNRFAARFANRAAGGVLVLLEPDVAKAFGSSEKLNAFLRATLAAVKR